MLDEATGRWKRIAAAEKSEVEVCGDCNLEATVEKVPEEADGEVHAPAQGVPAVEGSSSSSSSSDSDGDGSSDNDNVDGKSAGGNNSAGEGQQRDEQPDEETLDDDEKDDKKFVTPVKMKRKDVAAFGREMLHIIEDLTPGRSPGKMALKRAFTSACVNAGISKRIAKKAAPNAVIKKWDKALSSAEVNQGGRPKGSFRHSNEAVREVMRSECRPSSKASVKWEEPKLIMQSSVQAMHDNNPKLNKMYAARTLQRKVAGGKLGISRPSCDTDKCEICM